MDVGVGDGLSKADVSVTITVKPLRDTPKLTSLRPLFFFSMTKFRIGIEMHCGSLARLGAVAPSQLATKNARKIPGRKATIFNK